MEDKIFAILKKLDNLVESHFGYRIEPEVVIKPMGRRVAGLADYGKAVIYLNEDY